MSDDRFQALPSNRVRERGEQLVAPFIQKLADGGQYLIIEGGPLALYLQKACGDYHLRIHGEIGTLELKTEEKSTGNLFLEMFSNRNLQDPAKHFERGTTPGWLVTSKARWLAYAFLDYGVVYVCSMLQLQRWAFCKERVFSGDYPLKCQGRYPQLNDTWGFCAPIRVLQHDLGRYFHKFRVNQGELFPEVYQPLELVSEAS